MPSKRLELTVSEELWGRMEEARGDVSRAKWVKLALEAFLEPKRLDPRVDRVAVALEARDAVRERNEKVQPRTESTHRVQRPQFVRATSLVTPEIRSEWAEIMAARQARLNRKRDGDAA